MSLPIEQENVAVSVIQAKIGCILLFAMTFIGSCSPANADKLGVVEQPAQDEGTVRFEIDSNVVAAVRQRDFLALDEMALDNRSKRLLTPSGTWKSDQYYAAFDLAFGPVDRANDCIDAAEGFVSEWITARPKSPTPEIVKAQRAILRAGCIRGSDYADAVPTADLASFEAILQSTEKSLKANQNKLSVDPEYYALLARIYTNLGHTAAFDELIAQAADVEPYYYRLYFLAIIRYLPQWGGSVGDVEQFALYATDNTTSGSGKGLYARLYWVLNDCNCADDDVIAALDWDDVKAGMDDVYEHYPTDWNTANFARLACLRNDREATAKYLGLVKTSFVASWTHAEREACQRFAGSA